MELIFLIYAAVILGAVMIYMTLRNPKPRDRTNESITEAATRAEYEHPESYDEKPFERMLRPKK